MPLAADRAGTTGIRAIVAEATYALHSHHAKDKVGQLGPLWLVQWAIWLVTPDSDNALDVVGNLSPVPLLLVHGTVDRGVRPSHSDWLFEAAGEPKDIWRIDGAAHLDVFHSADQRERLAAYLKRSLSDSAGP